MAYIIGLFLILTVIFSGVTGNNIAGNFISGAWDQIKNRISSAIFPKTEKEIVIENLNKNYGILSRFFSESTPKLLELKDISQKDKDTIKNTAQIFFESQKLIDSLTNLEKEDKSLTKAIIQKALDLGKKSENKPEPTYIPPQCRLECSSE